MRESLIELLRRNAGEDLIMDITEEKHMAVVSITNRTQQFHFIVAGGLASFSDIKQWVDEAGAWPCTPVCNGVK